jgi:DNA topoisomerase-3
MRSLIICEKPSVAGEFSKALNCKPARGYFCNDRYIITYCLGHPYRLWEPGDYRAKWKKWSLGHLPIVPGEYRYKKEMRTEGQADIVSGLIMSHMGDDILIATDAGREGELIARIALGEAGLQDLSRCKRFWVSEALTDDVIRRSIASAKPLSAYATIADQGPAACRLACGDES